MESIDVAERDAITNGWPAPQSHTEQAAIMLPQQGNVGSEVVLLEHFLGARPLKTKD